MLEGCFDLRKVLEMGLGISYIPQGWVRICDGVGGNHITYIKRQVNNMKNKKLCQLILQNCSTFASVLTRLQNFGSLTQTSSQII
jgi:hypothetical protein